MVDRKVINDVERILLLSQRVLAHLQKNKIAKAKRELRRIIKFDLDELSRLQKEHGDKRLLDECGVIFRDAKKALEYLETFQKTDNVNGLVNEISNLEGHHFELIKQELRRKDLNYDDLKEQIISHPHDYNKEFIEKSFRKGAITEIQRTALNVLSEWYELSPVKLGFDVYVSFCDALAKSKESKKIKPSVISVDNITGPVQRSLQFWNTMLQTKFSLYYPKLNQAIKKGLGVKIKDNTVFLQPVDIIKLSDRPFKHRGVIEGANGNNIENLVVHSCFGSPEVVVATYIAHPDGQVLTFQENVFGVRKITSRVDLLLDPAKLLEYRNVFVDPETISEEGFGQFGPKDVFGHSFFVVGGIPKEAIVDFKLWKH